MKKAEKNLKFEEALERLEFIVEKLEGGELALDESLKFFEEGVGLSRYCEAKLSEAKGKIEELALNFTEDPKDS